MLQPIKAIIHTVTSDNGKEFAYHKKIAAALDVDFYFANPYHSWEREPTAQPTSFSIIQLFEDLKSWD